MRAVLGFLGKPEFLRAFHGWCTAFWLPFTALAYVMGWLESVIFVSVVSMIALFLGSFSSWQAARVEVKQDENGNGDSGGCCEHCERKKKVKDSNTWNPFLWS